MAYLGNDLKVAYPTYVNIDDISGSFNGSTTSFALLVRGAAPTPLPLNSQQCLISVAGVLQRPDDTGTEGFRLSGGNIVFSSAPASGADFFGVILAGADYVNAGGTYPDGSAAVPSITFTDDTDTGLFRSSSGVIGITCNSTSAGALSSTGLQSVLGSAANPSLSFVGDTNTGIFSPGADTLAFAEGGVEAMRIDSSARLLVGTSTDLGGGISNRKLQVASDNGGFAVLSRDDSSIVSGDAIGAIEFIGRHGGNTGRAADIFVYADADHGTNDYPGRLVFSTTADGASSPTERMRIASNGAISTVVPGGSTLYPAYDCRAWVNFNGTSTVSIRASGNVSSITDNGTGDYTINFTNAMADANYAVAGAGGNGASLGTVFLCPRGADPTASAVRVLAINAADTVQDTAFNSISVFR